MNHQLRPTLTALVQFSRVRFLVQQNVYSLLRDMEEVRMHNGKILISAPTKGAHDMALQEILMHVQVGGDRVCPCEYISRRGVPQMGQVPTSSNSSPLSVYTRLHTPLVRLHSRTIALLQLTAPLLFAQQHYACYECSPHRSQPYTHGHSAR